MRLVGQLSNPSPRLQSILDLSSIRFKPEVQVQSESPQRRHGNGVVQRAVMRVLSDADGPMKTGAVHAGVEALLKHPVSKESVSWVLRMKSRGEDRRCERVAYATYCLRSAG
jgi:hypothetical protein